MARVRFVFGFVSGFVFGACLVSILVRIGFVYIRVFGLDSIGVRVCLLSFGGYMLGLESVWYVSA